MATIKTKIGTEESARKQRVEPTGGITATNAQKALEGLDTGKVSTSTLGVANGVATLDSGGKLTPSQVPASLIGALQYQGTWNASTNTPTLASGVGTKGFYYKVSVAGSTSIDGISQWNVGDSIVFDGTTWDKIDGLANEVVSVFGRTGAVTQVAGDLPAFGSGDVSFATGGGAGTIAANAIVNAKVSSAAAITSDKLSYTNPAAGAVARSILSKLQDVVSVLDFGADPTGVADSTTAIQNAVNSLGTAGGILLVPGSGYKCSGTITLSNPILIVGNPGARITTPASITATGTATLFSVQSSGVSFRDISLLRSGASGNCFDVGTNVTTIADAVINIGTPTTLTSATANFTANDVGKYIAVNGASAGSPLLTTISARTNSTTVTLANAATAGVSGATAKYGAMYSGFSCDRVQITNGTVGFNLGSVGEYRISDCFVYCQSPFIINNLVSAGFGASTVSDCEIYCNNNSFYGVVYTSGGDVRFDDNKFLGGTYCFNMQWTVFPEGNLTISGGSMENFTTAAFFGHLDIGFERINLNNITVAGTAGVSTFVLFDNASTAIPVDIIITNNNVRLVGSTSVGIDIGKAQQVIISDNIIDFGGTGTGIALRSNSSSCTVGQNYLSVATPFTNAGTSNLFNTSTGVTVANLPASAANGSRVFATDGVPGSSPLAGSGTGAMAFRQNGAWVGQGPGGSITSALSADVTLNNVGTYFDGPSIAQGTVGTWFVIASITVLDSVGVSTFLAKLWDGTTVINSTVDVSGGGGSQVSITLSGIITSPAGNLKISVLDSSRTTGLILANAAGAGNNSSRITALRIA